MTCSCTLAADFHTHGLFVAVNVTLVAGGSMTFLPAVRRRSGGRAAAVGDHADGGADLHTRMLAHPAFDQAR
ncbi:MAG: hypothetical protein R2695_20460 [Acidimicrobiales bacterium]